MTDLYWWFSRTDCRLGYDDGRVAALGVTHEVDGAIQLCQHGLHAAVRAIDALAYAPGPVVWRVTLGGEVIHGDDKAVASVREYVAGGFDCSNVLRVAARQFALRVIHLWDCPPVVQQYLETGDESLRDAVAAAAWAAEAAAGARAGAAAWAAARAAGAAAGAAAEAAERAAQEKILAALLAEKLGDIP